MVAVVFASGTFLLLQRDLTRVVVGIILVSNSAVLFIISAGLTRGVAPILPLESEGAGDPLVQAMALTALVIGFGVAALLLAMVYRLYTTHGTVDLEEIADAEMREAEALERTDDPETRRGPGRGARPGGGSRDDADGPALIVLPAGIPWVLAALLTFLDGRKRWVGLLGAAGLAASLASLVWLAVVVLREGTVETVAGGWPEGVGISLRADALGVTFAARLGRR